MATTRRKNFIYRLSLTGLFIVTAILSYQSGSGIWWIWVIVSVAMLFDAIRFAVATQRQGGWNEEYVTSGNFKKENSYIAGHRAFWSTIILLIGGVALHMTGFLLIDLVTMMAVIILLGLSAFIGFRLFYNARR